MTDPVSLSEEDVAFYRLEKSDSAGECQGCGQSCEMWTIVFDSDGEPCEVGTSWGHKETAEDICDLMNMAYDAGQESQIDNAEEQKLVEFFRSREGDAIGRNGDHDSLTPAETAIRAMRGGMRDRRSLDIHRPDNCDCGYCTGVIP